MESREIKFEEMVAQLAKPGAAIIETLTPAKAHLLHMAIGVVGEVAELIEGAFYNAAGINRENFIEELGDIEFYLEGMRQGLGVSREQICDQDNLSAVSKERAEAPDFNPVAVITITAGGVLDLVKKHVIYNKDLDTVGLYDLLALIEVSLSMIRGVDGINYDEVIEANIYKLATGPKARYKAGYSDQAAQDRADKAA